MSGITKPKVFGIAVAFFCALTPASVPVVVAQQSGQTAPSVPLAARLNAARSVFVSNSKGESVTDPKAKEAKAKDAKTKNDQAASRFHAAMKSWNQYRLVSASADADLIMQVFLEKSQVRLTILDPSTGAVLASMIEPIENDLLFGAREKNLNQATSALVDDLRRLMVQRATPLPPGPAPIRASGNRPPKIFVSNVGSENDEFPGRGITGGPGQAFNKFYAALQSSRQYDLVTSPGGADFVFEMRYTAPAEQVSKWVNKANSDTNPPEQERVEYTVYHPQIRLVILDARTLAVQGTFTEQIGTGYNQPMRDARLSQALNALVNDASTRLGRPPVSIFLPPVVNVAPVPSQITAAKTVFLSHAAGTGMYGGTPSSEQAYNEFYAMMKSWGGYQLSATPTGADLIFEVSVNSQFHLAILDPQTKITLWGFTPEVKAAILKGNAQKNFDSMLAALIQDIARLAGRPAAAMSVPQSVDAAPIPPQISTAQTVFVTNTGEESLTDIKEKITYHAYDGFYATMKSWGRYELVPTASQADLVMQMSLSGSNIRVAILDAKTHVTLFGLKQNIHGVFRGTVQERDLNDAIAALARNIARLAGQATAEISVPAGIKAAPVPSRISDSNKVFLSRPRYDSGFPEEQAPDQLYGRCYADMKSWDRYQLTTPSDADLIFEPSAYDNWVRLTIRDAKTRDVLWTFTQPVKTAFLASNARKNYIAAIGLLMDDVHRVVALGAQTSSTSAAKREE